MKTSVIMFLIFYAQITMAQNTLVGSIIDVETSQPIANAHVILIDENFIGVTSDQEGKFSISLSEMNKKGDLLIQMIGYRELIAPFDLEISENLPIVLERTYVSIEEVSIIASKSVAEEFVVERLNKIDVYTNPNSRADPVRAINSLPYGTSVDESANLSLRGSPANETGYVINNVPMDDIFRIDQANGIGQFSIFNTSIIQNVDVFPSNPPIEYGNSSSGLVALKTDEFSGTKGQSINLTLASLGANVSRKISDRHSLVAYANIGFDDGLRKLNPNAFDRIRDLNSIDIGLYWVSNFKNQSKLKLFNYTLVEDFDYHVKQPSFEGSALQMKKRNLTIANFEKNISEHLKIDINQGMSFTQAQYDFGNTSHHLAKNDFFSSVNTSYFTDKYNFKLGISTAVFDYNGDGQYASYHWALDKTHPITTYNSSNNFVNPEIYLYNKVLLSENISLGFGGRKSLGNLESEHPINSYQINLSYRPDNINQVIISHGRYYKISPDREIIENINIINSTHYSVDYGLELENVGLKAAVYLKKTIYPSHILDIHGGEVYVSYTSEKVKTSFSASHINSKVTSENLTYPSDHDIGIFLRHLLKYKITDVIEINSSMLYRTGSYIQPITGSIFHEATSTYQPIFQNIDDGIRLPSYTLWDISLSHISEVKNGSILTFVNCSNFLNLKNVSGIVYNEKYEPIADELFNPRVIFFGFVYNWN